MWTINKILLIIFALGFLWLNSISGADVPVAEAQNVNIATPVTDDLTYCGDYLYEEVLPNGEQVILTNNVNATDVTYAQLKAFIKSDKTDSLQYINDVYVCSNYALDVHDNAENAGIRSGWVGIDFTDGSRHACNVFNTTDRGLVFIDCTGNENGEPDNNDATVMIMNGLEYSPVYMFSDDWTAGDMGTVYEYVIYW